MNQFKNRMALVNMKTLKDSRYFYLYTGKEMPICKEIKPTQLHLMRETQVVNSTGKHSVSRVPLPRPTWFLPSQGRSFLRSGRNGPSAHPQKFFFADFKVRKRSLPGEVRLNCEKSGQRLFFPSIERLSPQNNS